MLVRYDANTRLFQWKWSRHTDAEIHTATTDREILMLPLGLRQMAVAAPGTWNGVLTDEDLDEIRFPR